MESSQPSVQYIENPMNTQKVSQNNLNDIERLRNSRYPMREEDNSEIEKSYDERFSDMHKNGKMGGRKSSKRYRRKSSKYSRKNNKPRSRKIKRRRRSCH